ncbi:MAG: hypothetical protein HY855_25030 [Burkholderiales bacterium]|nr:hypothetical protein [Burkholderiales bacterium]
MNATVYILIATVIGQSPQGAVSVPVRLDFKTRPECVDFLDKQITAARSQFKGPLTLTLHTFCERREVTR